MLSDKNFVNFLNDEATQWFCIINNDDTFEQDFCTSSQHYKAASDRGVTFGSAGWRTSMLQQSANLDNKAQYPIVELSFDYQLKADLGDSVFSVQLVPPSNSDEVTLLTQVVTASTDWQHVSFDLHYYTAGTPTIEFEMNNSAGDAATVTIRKVRLVVKSYATLQAEFINQLGDPIASGRLKIKNPQGVVYRRKKLDDDGTVTLLTISGRAQPYRLELNHRGKRYFTKQRFRFGSDYIDTFQLNPATHRLVRQTHERYY